jgi:hypothetical protein
LDLVEIISSVPSSVICRIALSSEIFNGSEKIFLSTKGISCSCNHARALRQDVQLGEVYSVNNVHLSFLIFNQASPVPSLDFNYTGLTKKNLV